MFVGVCGGGGEGNIIEILLSGGRGKKGLSKKYTEKGFFGILFSMGILNGCK